MIVVSDSTILIGLAKIEMTELLRDIFGTIHIPDAVYGEVVKEGAEKPGAKIVENARWIVRRKIADHVQAGFLMATLEKGEAEVLVLAREMNAGLVLLDEEKARKSAAIAGFKVMGVIGVLLAAKELGLIRKVRTYIERLQKENFRVSERIVHKVLKQAGEASIS